MRILVFTITIAVLTGLLFGLAPAWRSGRVDPQTAMKAQGRGVAEGHSRFSAGKALVVAQVALSLVLVAGAGLLLGSWRKLATLDPGFQRDHVLLVDSDLGPAPVLPEQRHAAYAQIVERLRAIPGVVNVGMSQMTPTGLSAWNNGIKVDGFTAQSKRDAISWMNAVGASYFASLRIPLLAGRDFNSTDTPESPTVAIVSAEMARKFFGTTAAIGRHFQMDQGKTYSDSVEIIGVVGDTKYRSLRDSIKPIVYLADSQEKTASQNYSFEIRTATPPSTVVAQVKSAIAAVNPRISLDITTLEQQVDESMSVMRTIASLSSVFGALALGAAGAILLVVGLVAASVPAWRAARLDPVAALRGD